MSMCELEEQQQYLVK